MARISRIVAIGYPHHITQRGVRSLDIFHSQEDRHHYLQFKNQKNQERFPYFQNKMTNNVGSVPIFLYFREV